MSRGLPEAHVEQLISLIKGQEGQPGHLAGQALVGKMVQQATWCAHQDLWPLLETLLLAVDVAASVHHLQVQGSGMQMHDVPLILSHLSRSRQVRMCSALQSVHRMELVSETLLPFSAWCCRWGMPGQ